MIYRYGIVQFGLSLFLGSIALHYAHAQEPSIYSFTSSMAMVKRIGHDGWFLHQYDHGKTKSYRHGPKYLVIELVEPAEYSGKIISIAIEDESELCVDARPIAVGDILKFKVKRSTIIGDFFRIGLHDNFRCIAVEASFEVPDVLK